MEGTRVSEAQLTGRDEPASSRLATWAPVGIALLYPWALVAFHMEVAVAPGRRSLFTAISACAWLIIAFLLPLSCIGLALARNRLPGIGQIGPKARKLAYMGVTVPPLFVLTGVLSGILHSPVRDIWIWSAAWIGLGAVAMLTRERVLERRIQFSSRLRVIHGVSAVVILAYVAFHLFNHLMGLAGPTVHAQIMKLGRRVYRSEVGEPILVSLMLFQVATGLRLAWRKSGHRLDVQSTIQLASGTYLAAFILTHLNSALISARAVHRVPTDWAWATGAPSGLIVDAWNIRLVPHYALGVFFVIAHLACGLRQVLLAHQVQARFVQRIWVTGLIVAAGIAITITCGLCGLRI